MRVDQAEGQAKKQRAAIPMRKVQPPSRETVDLARAASTQLTGDLNAYLAQAADVRRRLKFVAKKTEIHEKTIQRLARGESRPAYITIFKLYRFLLNERDDAKLLTLVPPAVRQYLERANPQSIDRKTAYIGDIEREIRTNPVMAEIAILCASGPLKLSYIRGRFGKYGIEVLQQMIDREIVQNAAPGEVCSGKNQINMSPETIVAFGSMMARAHLRTEKSYELGENFMGFYTHDLSPEAYKQWLAIEAEAFKKKVEIAKHVGNRGTVRAFAFSAIDAVDTDVFERKAKESP